MVSLERFLCEKDYIHHSSFEDGGSYDSGNVEP